MGIIQRYTPLAMSPNQKRYRLLQDTYSSPKVIEGDRLWCTIRKRNLKVCGWNKGRIPWPMGRIGHGGKGAYIVTPELAHAVRTESEAAICYWWGVGITTVSKWRRALKVDQFNDGTRRLYSLWKKAKLPDRTVRFRPAALRQARRRCGLTGREVAARMGWTSINSYGQMESGRRRRAALPILRRLAAALECTVESLR